MTYTALQLGIAATPFAGTNVRYMPAGAIAPAAALTDAVTFDPAAWTEAATLVAGGVLGGTTGVVPATASGGAYDGILLSAAEVQQLAIGMAAHAEALAHGGDLIAIAPSDGILAAAQAKVTGNAAPLADGAEITPLFLGGPVEGALLPHELGILAGARGVTRAFAGQSWQQVSGKTYLNTWSSVPTDTTTPTTIINPTSEFLFLPAALITLAVVSVIAIVHYFDAQVAADVQSNTTKRYALSMAQATDVAQVNAGAALTRQRWIQQQATGTVIAPSPLELQIGNNLAAKYIPQEQASTTSRVLVAGAVGLGALAAAWGLSTLIKGSRVRA